MEVSVTAPLHHQRHHHTFGNPITRNVVSPSCVPTARFISLLPNIHGETVSVQIPGPKPTPPASNARKSFADHPSNNNVDMGTESPFEA
jgi:hypothetical protein